jgi:T4 beta protein
MDMVSDYFLLFKTAQSEFRAWKELNKSSKSETFPIIELTRGRKISGSGEGIPEENWASTEGIYAFQSNVDKVKDLFKQSNRTILDITREENLFCYELAEISKSNNGYENWVNFVNNLKLDMGDVIPTIQVNPDENEDATQYKTNIITQTKSLMDISNGVAYRASVIIDLEFVYDLTLLKDEINNYIEQGNDFYIILDHEFIIPRSGIVHAARTHGLIENIAKIIPNAIFVILSTSFPKVIDDIGDPNHDSFPQEEVFLFQQISSKAPTLTIKYGDYGSINPVRNDLQFASGWRPRIDFPTSRNKTFYYREKRVTTYKDHYVSVAKNVVSDARFEELKDSWGVKMIKEAANGNPAGKSPSFWISVRMEIHINQQLKRLGLT